ncbi:MAG: DUF554 domain-containing protein [Saprospiraceae bacterium]
MQLPKGTLINVVTVTLGSLIGLTLKNLISSSYEIIVFQALGLGTILIGIKMALKCPEGYLLHIIFSLILGGVLGEFIHLDQVIDSGTLALKHIISNEDAGFSEGLVTAFILFCVGSMTFLGALEEGMTGNNELLLVKSTLDGFSSIFLSATFGVGVLFSIIPLFIFQSSLTLGARRISKYLNDNIIQSISSLGGLLILGISINLLKIGNVHLENLLPGLLLVVMVTKYFPIGILLSSKRN